MANPVTTTDIADRWRPLTTAEETTAQARLGDAWAVLLSRIPDLEDRLADGRVSLELVTFVVCEMVLRALRNPGAFTQETTGPFSVTRDSSVATGGIYVTDDELAMLRGEHQVATVGTIETQPAWPTVTCPYPYESRWPAL